MDWLCSWGFCSCHTRRKARGCLSFGVPSFLASQRPWPQNPPFCHRSSLGWTLWIIAGLWDLARALRRRSRIRSCPILIVKSNSRSQCPSSSPIKSLGRSKRKQSTVKRKPVNLLSAAATYPFVSNQAVLALAGRVQKDLILVQEGRLLELPILKICTRRRRLPRDWLMVIGALGTHCRERSKY